MTNPINYLETKKPCQMNYILLLALAVFTLSPPAFAVCTSLVKGYIAFNVNSCIKLSPEKTFTSSNPRFGFVDGLGAADKKAFFDSYRGLLVKGLVVRSLATRSGLSEEKGALNGEEIQAFIEPGKSSCRELSGSRIKGLVDEACCQAGGDVPCLLNTSFLIKDPVVLGSLKGGAGNARRMKLSSSKKFKKANQKFKEKDFPSAIEIYEDLRAKDQLDLRGYYYLSLAYRLSDQCDEAAPVLKVVYDKSLNKDYWVNEEKFVRKAVFLYARCLSRIGKTGESILVLNSFLTNPSKFKPEISASLKHRDFGRIKTTKEFTQYTQDAKRALGQN